jgi:hypothetical protein
MKALDGFVKERGAGPVPRPGVFTVGTYSDHD